MPVLEDNIKRINNKLQQLLKLYQLTQKENEKLRKEVKQLKEHNEATLQQIDQLQQQVNILKSVAGQMNDTDKKTFEKQISRYIKEIDKCISLLSE